MDIHLRLSRGKIHTQVLGIDGTQFFVGCWTECLGLYLAVDWRLPSVPCHLGLPKSHLHPQSQQEREPSVRTVIVCDAITQFLTFPRFHWLEASLRLYPHSKGGDLDKGVNTATGAVGSLSGPSVISFFMTFWGLED